MLLGGDSVKKLFLGFSLLFLAGCELQNKLSEPVVESIESEHFRLKVEVPSVLLEEGDKLKVSGSLTYLGDEPIELVHGNPPILLSLAGQGGGTEDIAIATEMAPGDSITIDTAFTLLDTGIYSLQTETTTLKMDGEFIEGAGVESSKSPEPRFQESFESRLSLEPIEITVK